MVSVEFEEASWLEAAGVGTLDWDVREKRVTASLRARELWGLSPHNGEVTPGALTSRIHPDDLPGFEAAVERCASDRSPLHHDIRVIHSSGAARWIGLRATLSCDADGRPARVRGAIFELLHGDPQPSPSSGERSAHAGEVDRLSLLNAGLQAAERTAREERDFFTAVLDSLPGILYFYDESGQFQRWNRNFERVTGFSAEQIRGLHPLDLFAGDDRARVAARIEDVFRTGESNVEADLVSKDGRATAYYFTGTSLQLDGKKCLVGVGIDISERKRAEEARQASEVRYRALFDHAPDGILLANGESTYLDANPSMCRMLGYNRDELVGMNAQQIIAFDDAHRIPGTLDAIHSDGQVHQEYLFRRRDGSTFPAEVIASSMPDGSILGLIRDITDRKRAETALTQLNESLEARVAARTSELAAALVRAEAADQLKSAFLATMSHELRTPLNSIIGFTGIILQGMAGPINEEQTKQLGMVRGSARHLLELINDVLDLSKLEARQVQVRAEAFAPRATIDRAVASVEPEARKKGLSLSATVDPGLDLIVSDRRRFEQILLNLLNNAIKFTERGSVCLTAERVDLAPRGGGAPGPHLRLCVADTGIGIRPEDLSKLFQPFQQVDFGLARQHEGTGLGLAICRRLTELLGGELTVESVWGAGSKFELTLPLSQGAR